jgi:GNAT superfamily N-acetyltransferase
MTAVGFLGAARTGVGHGLGAATATAPNGALRDDGLVERAQVAIVNPVEVEETASWLAAMTGPFLSDPTGPSVARWAEVVARVWDPARAWGARDGGRWVATLRTEPRMLTVPDRGGQTRDLPVDAVTNVTVSATHRRRGLMSEMLDRAMRAAQVRGDAVSILIPAEWPIYGRFGYAPATWSADYVLYRNRGGGGPVGDLAGVRPSDIGEIAAVGADVFASFRRQRAGQVGRDRLWWNIALGQDGFPTPPQDSGLAHNWIVHEGSAGVDGIVGWRATRQGGFNPPGGRAEVWDLFAANDTAYRDLWAYLWGIDLIDEIALSRRPVDESIRWLMADGRSLVLKDRADFLWLRLLDVPAALSARGYAIAGELVLEVRDDAPATRIDVSGRYRLRDGRMHAHRSPCRPPAHPAGARLDLPRRGASRRAGRLGSAGRADAGRGGTRPADVLHAPATLERHQLLETCARAIL